MTGRRAGLEFTVEAPGLLQDAAARQGGRQDERIAADDQLARRRDRAEQVQRHGSVDFAGKPVVKLDLDFQRLDLAVAGGAASANPGAAGGP